MRHTVLLIICLSVILHAACAGPPKAESGASDVDRPTENRSGSETRVFSCNEGFTECGYKELETLVEECENDHVLACEAAGIAYDRRSEAEKARPHLKRACELQSPSACNALGEQLLEDEEFEGALDQFRRTCDRGFPEACYNEARMYDGDGAERDPMRAFELYRASCYQDVAQACEGLQTLMDREAGEIRRDLQSRCDSEEEASCAQLGYFYEEGRGGVDADTEHARQLYEASCDADESVGCRRLARLGIDAAFQGGEAERIAIDEVVPQLEVACESGDAEACLFLGTAFREGSLGEVDARRALEAFQHGCRARSSEACRAKAQFYLRGDGAGDPDPHRGLSLLATRCLEDMQRSCYDLGSIYLNGDGVETDLEHAYNLFSLACSRGQLDGCTSVGVMHAAGQGVEVDYAKAHQFYSKACDGGHPTGCANLGSLYMLGDGVPQDHARARRLFEYACDRGEQEGCKRLQILEQID